MTGTSFHRSADCLADAAQYLINVAVLNFSGTKEEFAADTVAVFSQQNDHDPICNDIVIYVTDPQKAIWEGFLQGIGHYDVEAEFYFKDYDNVYVTLMCHSIEGVEFLKSIIPSEPLLLLYDNRVELGREAQ